MDDMHDPYNIAIHPVLDRMTSMKSLADVWGKRKSSDGISEWEFS
ncbi:hypothetical protein MTsN3n11_12130 [Qipengyuania sp. MTN3-11]